MPNQVALLHAKIEAGHPGPGALHGEIMQIVAQAGRLGGARWRCGYIADGIIDLLRKRGRMPDDDGPLTLGQPVLCRKEFAHLPRSQQRRINDLLAHHRIGWWEWERIEQHSPADWLVTLWQHHPLGGVLFIFDGDEAMPGLYERIVDLRDGA